MRSTRSSDGSTPCRSDPQGPLGRPELQGKAGVVNAIDFNYRYYPLVQEAKDMVESGKFGDVFHATGSYTQDWLYLPTDWNWRLVPEYSGGSRAVAY